MPIIDTRTVNFNWKRPNAANNVKDDVVRLDETFVAIDAALAATNATVTGKASVASLSSYQLLSAKNAVNGYAGLNGSGQLADSVIPLSFAGGLNYKGSWNASTNSPAIPAAATVNKGWFYIVTVAGSTLVNGESDWQIGDWIVSNGTTWSKVDNTDRVASVAGKIGAVTLVANDISNASTDGKSILTATDYAAIKTLLAIPGASSETVVGSVELATTAETVTGSDTTRAVTPAGVAAVVAALPAGVPVGVYVPYAGATAPSGWLLCDGAAISRTTYAALFTAISTAYGVGNGTTTFNIPDMRGRVAVGKDNMGGTAANRMTTGGSGVDGLTLGANGGAETHALTSGQNGPHTHTASGIGPPNVYIPISSGGTSPGFSTVTTSSSGSGAAHNNTQPSLVGNYIIKT